MRTSIASFLAVAVVAGLGCSGGFAWTHAAGASLSCPVTQPNGSKPPGESSFNYGNGTLWVALYPNGTLDNPLGVRPDGAIYAKFGWFRGVPGTLTISGNRLDAEAPPLRADVATGYDETGFQPSGILFPTRGCWHVVGQLGSVTLGFVVAATVGRETRRVPVATLLRPRVSRSTVVIRWRGGSPGLRFDLSVRRDSAAWTRLLTRTVQRRYVLASGHARRIAIRVRGRDDWGVGPWSSPLVVRSG